MIIIIIIIFYTTAFVGVVKAIILQVLISDHGEVSEIQTHCWRCWS